VRGTSVGVHRDVRGFGPILTILCALVVAGEPIAGEPIAGEPIAGEPIARELVAGKLVERGGGRDGDI
ncbi:MAG: hypothetical protein ABEL51_12890, partial [Salinibacter sp.]